jgi:hypothetical protein
MIGLFSGSGADRLSRAVGLAHQSGRQQHEDAVREPALRSASTPDHGRHGALPDRIGIYSRGLIEPGWRTALNAVAPYGAGESQIAKQLC